jgi:hypothetical protein
MHQFRSEIIKTQNLSVSASLLPDPTPLKTIPLSYLHTPQKPPNGTHFPLNIPEPLSTRSNDSFPPKKKNIKSSTQVNPNLRFEPLDYPKKDSEKASNLKIIDNNNFRVNSVSTCKNVGAKYPMNFGQYNNIIFNKTPNGVKIVAGQSKVFGGKGGVSFDGGIRIEGMRERG